VDDVEEEFPAATNRMADADVLFFAVHLKAAWGRRTD